MGVGVKLLSSEEELQMKLILAKGDWQITKKISEEVQNSQRIGMGEKGAEAGQKERKSQE